MPTPMPFCRTCGGRVYPGSVRCPQCGDLVPPELEPPPQPVLYLWAAGVVGAAMLLSFISLFPNYEAGQTLHDNAWTLWFNVVALLAMGVGVTLLLGWRSTRPHGAALIVGLGPALAGNYLTDWSTHPFQTGFWFGQTGQLVLLVGSGLAVAALVADPVVHLRLTGRHRAFVVAGLGVAVLVLVAQSLNQYHLVATAQPGYLFGSSPSSAASYGRVWDSTGLALAGAVLPLIITVALLAVAGGLEPPRTGAALTGGVLVQWASNLLSTLIFISKSGPLDFHLAQTAVASVNLTLAPGGTLEIAAVVLGALLVMAMAVQPTSTSDYVELAPSADPQAEQ